MILAIAWVPTEPTSLDNNLNGERNNTVNYISWVIYEIVQIELKEMVILFSSLNQPHSSLRNATIIHVDCDCLVLRLAMDADANNGKKTQTAIDQLIANWIEWKCVFGSLCVCAYWLLTESNGRRWTAICGHEQSSVCRMQIAMSTFPTDPKNTHATCVYIHIFSRTHSCITRASSDHICMLSMALTPPTPLHAHNFRVKTSNYIPKNFYYGSKISLACIQAHHISNYIHDMIPTRVLCALGGFGSSLCCSCDALECREHENINGRWWFTTQPERNENGIRCEAISQAIFDNFDSLWE